MDDSQVQKRLLKIEEKARADAERYRRLNERIDAFEKLIGRHSADLKSLAGETSDLTATNERLDNLERTIDRQQKEVARRLRDWEKERHALAQQLSEGRKEDQKALSESQGKLDVMQETINALKVDMKPQQEEIERLGRELSNILVRFDALQNADEHRERSLASLEELHSQTMRRIAELQTETEDLRLKQDRIYGTLDAYEQQVKRFEEQLIPIPNSLRDSAEQMQTWQDEQEMKRVNFEREWKERQKQFEELETRAVELEEDMRSFDDVFRQTQQLNLDLEKTHERLERRIREISEIYRIADERMKHEWTTFQMDDQKRWNAFKLTNDEQWREHLRVHEKISAEWKGASERLSDLAASLSELRDSVKQRVLDVLEILQNLGAELGEGPEE
jgi:chromosome segregation ATPase